MDILLTHAYFLRNDPVEQKVRKPYVPLGFLAIGAYLKTRGVSCGLFDSTFSSHEEFEAFLTRNRPTVVGIYVTLMTRGAAVRMAAAARRAGSKVLLGGPEPASYAEEFLSEGADVVVVGEAEETVLELLPALEGPAESLSGIPGIICRDDRGTIVRTPPRPLIQSLDLLPFPARDQIDMDPYLQTWRSAHDTTSLSINTMRGCPFTCRWCSHGVYGTSYRRRSATQTVEEISQITEAYRPDQLWFTDDVFTINHGWVSEFERALSNRGVRISYECITRADRLNEQVIRSLKATGCRRVWIGSESGSQRVLDAMDRRVTVGQVQAMSLMAQRYGIEVGMFLMLGYAGETKSDVGETIRHVRRARPNFVLTTVAYPIKGTPYYDDLRAHLRLPSLSFAEWNDRMIEITNRYSKLFYWFANRRVINEAALDRALHQPSPDYGTIIRSFVKANIARAGMAIAP